MNAEVEDKKVEDEGEESDDKIVIEVEDDTPDKDKGRERRAEGKDAEIPPDEEIEKYGEKVQTRLKSLKWEFHEERRGKEEAQRLRDQAVDFARGQHNELARLRKILSAGENEHVTVGRASATAQLESARTALRAANESGDSEAITRAQEALAQGVASENRWKDYVPQYQVDPNDPRLQPAAPPQPRQEFRPPAPSSEATEWAEENPWFRNDERMTGYAFGVHKDLINKEGIAVDSKKYYTRLDEEMRKGFPTAFSDDGDQKRQKPASQKTTVVASGSRTQGRPRKVKLTQSMIALASRLGITPEAYAAEMLKQESGQ